MVTSPVVVIPLAMIPVGIAFDPLRPGGGTRP